MLPRLILLTVLIVTALAATTINDCPPHVPRDRYLRTFGNSCFSFILYHKRSFEAAENECEARKGHLAIIRDSSTQDFIYRTLKNEFHYNDVAWIGLSDIKSEGHFVWVDGTPARYTNWAYDQPGILSGLEDCVAMDVGSGGNWHDYNCDDFLFVNHEYYFVCEYPAVHHTTPTTTSTTTTTTTTPTTTSTTTTPTPTTVTTTEPTTQSSTTTQQPTTTVTSTTTATTTATEPTTTCTTQQTTTPSVTTLQSKTESNTTPHQTSHLHSTHQHTKPTTTTTPTTGDTSHRPSKEPTTVPTTSTIPTTTTALRKGGCPPFQCSLDCGLSGYKLDANNCLLCECEA